jgi:hypothetical protein
MLEEWSLRLPTCGSRGGGMACLVKSADRNSLLYDLDINARLSVDADCWMTRYAPQLSSGVSHNERPVDGHIRGDRTQL